jgi:hypothetical protein
VSYEDPRCTHLIIDAIPGDPIDLNIDFATINKHIYVVYKEVTIKHLFLIIFSLVTFSLFCSGFGLHWKLLDEPMKVTTIILFRSPVLNRSIVTARTICRKVVI